MQTQAAESDQMPPPLIFSHSFTYTHTLYNRAVCRWLLAGQC